MPRFITLNRTIRTTKASALVVVYYYVRYILKFEIFGPYHNSDRFTEMTKFIVLLYVYDNVSTYVRQKKLNDWNIPAVVVVELCVEQTIVDNVQKIDT